MFFTSDTSFSSEIFTSSILILLVKSEATIKKKIVQLTKFADFIHMNLKLNPKKIQLAALLLFFPFSTFAQENKSENVPVEDTPLFISNEEIRVDTERDANGKVKGYHLFIKKVSGLESVMLIETCKDPDGEEASYAYRATEYNAINGDEKRVLNGKELKSEWTRNCLVDSTDENDKEFTRAFHIFIPPIIVYGYPWSRHEKVKVKQGTFVNLRSFSVPYADYTGKYMDNPYMFDALLKSGKEEIFLSDDYNMQASESFDDISTTLTYSRGPATIVGDIMKCIQNMRGEEAQIVIVMDATGSMGDEVDEMRKNLMKALRAELARFRKFEIALVLYRDYTDTFFYKGLPIKVFPFTENLAEFERNLNGFVIHGFEGGDIPEAVYEGLYGALKFFDWKRESEKKIILIGDAEAHPSPRGNIKCTGKLVTAMARKRGVNINAILTPDEKERRGRKKSLR